MSSIAETIQPFVCGGLAACVASSAIHPIDLVKVRMQLAGQGSKSASPNPFTLASAIVKTSGVKGLYAGLSASLTRQATYGTARIGLHRQISQELEKYNEGNKIPFYQKAGSGMLSGAIAVCIGTPFDVALVRMQNDGSLPINERRNYTGVSDALTRIYKEEGLKRLWRGLSPNILRGMSMNLGMMACYDQAKQTIADITKQPDSLTTQLGAAGAAGLCCAVFSLPFDMLKSRLQNMQLDANGKAPYSGVADCAAKILKNEGPMAFFKGFTAYYGRCAPHAMIILMSIEQITSWYRKLLLPDKEAHNQQALVLSSKVSGIDDDSMSEGFFVLQRKTKELEAEIGRLRTELEGKVFQIGSRVVATGDSHWNHYKQGYTGVVQEINTDMDPLVRWDHSGMTLQTSKLKLSAYEELTLSDGLVLDFKAVGLRVKAVGDSGWKHYKKGDEGIITRLNPTDPVVRWDKKSGPDLQTSRRKLAAINKPVEVVEKKE
jgi:solute carrier family 25 oxoglutarate transporter 11